MASMTWPSVAPGVSSHSADTVAPFNAISAQDQAGTPVFTTGKSNQYSASLSGGVGAGRYFLSTNYQDDHGVEPNNSIKQFGAHANLNLTPNDKIDLASSLNYVQGTYHTGVDVGLSALLGAEFGHPLVFSVPGADGFYPNVPPAVPQTLFDNSDDIHRFTGSATFSHHPVNWFTQRLIVGLDYTDEDGRGLERFAPPALAPFTLGGAAGRIGQTLTSTSLTTLDYNGTVKVNLTPEELQDLMVLLRRCQNALARVMKPDGFNIGVNLGKCAGAGILEHLHIHIVPRWNGDTNFMPVIAGTGVVPQALSELAAQLRTALAQ